MLVVAGEGRLPGLVGVNPRRRYDRFRGPGFPHPYEHSAVPDPGRVRV